MIIEEMLAMELGKAKGVSGGKIERVPAGWIYHRFWELGGVTSTFVPEPPITVKMYAPSLRAGGPPR